MTKKLTGKAPMIAAIALGGVLLAAGAAVARGPGGGEAMFQQLDANGDGQITALEFQAFRDARVEGIDADGDGFVSQDEMVAMVQAEQAKRMADRIAARYGQLVQHADTDGDGKLSVEEFAAARETRERGPRFDDSGLPVGWDLNGDGVVTQQEFQTALADMQARRFGMRGEHGDRGPRGDN